MAADQVPSGNQGLRAGARGIGNRALQGLFEENSPAKRRYLRRNGPARVQFPQHYPDTARSLGMNSAGQRHIPVLGRQAIGMLQPRAGGIYVDATFGAGGFNRANFRTPRVPGPGADAGPAHAPAGAGLGVLTGARRT